jgi:repressor LexA
MQYIADYIRDKGIPPTLGEIGSHFKVSKVTIFEHLVQMEKNGVIKRLPSKSRAIEILDPDFAPSSPTRLPLVGKIAAGAPIEAIEQPENIDICSLINPDQEHYMLRVRGDSMIGDHIADGDLVIVEKRSTARDNEIVVAIIGDNEATLKRFFREGDRIRLQPANDALSPIYADHVDIRGVVVGILRKY